MTNEERLAALAKARAVRAAKIAAKKATEAAAQAPEPTYQSPTNSSQSSSLEAKVADVESEGYVLALEACVRDFLEATAVKYAAGDGYLTDRCLICEDHMIPGRANPCACQKARRLLAEKGSVAA